MTQVERIVSRLEEAGSRGLTTVELFTDLFCCNYRARISEARKRGYDIRCFSIQGSEQHRYFLFAAPSGPILTTSNEGHITYIGGQLALL